MKYIKVIYGYGDIGPTIEQGKEIDGFKMTKDLIFGDKVGVIVRQQPKEFMMLISGLDGAPRGMVQLTADENNENFEENIDSFLREFIISNKIKGTVFAK